MKEHLSNSTHSACERHRLDVTNDVRDADLVFVISNLDGTISSNVQGAVASAVLDEIPVHDITGYRWKIGKSDDAFLALVTDLRRQLDAADALDSAGEREIARSVIETHAALWILDHVVPDVPPEIGDEIIDALANASVITDHPYNLDDIPDEDDTTPPKP